MPDWRKGTVVETTINAAATATAQKFDACGAAVNITTIDEYDSYANVTVEELCRPSGVEGGVTVNDRCRGIWWALMAAALALSTQRGLGPVLTPSPPHPHNSFDSSKRAANTSYAMLLCIQIR